MRNRWITLSLLFLVRAAMAFQFQSVAALSPLVMAEYGLGLSELGVLIGLYLSPGLVIALPGGALGRRFTERRVVLFGLCLMLAGGLITLAVPGATAQFGGRLLAGIGGVLLNVLMSKMVLDVFSGREVSTAMAIFVNSWPVGIAAALLVLPPFAGAFGLYASFVAVAVVVAGGLVLFALYAPEAPAPPVGGAVGGRLRGRPLAAVLCSGATWGLYNGALGMVFGFAPAMLVARDWSLTAASAATSMVLWLVAVSVPLGGVLADKTGARTAVIAASLLIFAAALVAVGATPFVILSFVLIGLVGGLAAGPIMSLPGDVLTPETGAVGMGWFFTLFYAGGVGAPVGAGALAARTGLPEAPMYFGALLLIGACLTLVGFLRLKPARP